MNIFVYIWNTKVGTLKYNEDTKTSSFQYDLDFIDRGIQLSPIIMPLSTKTFIFDERIKSNYGLPPLLRDSLPDTYGNKIINIYLKNLGRNENSLTPAERLSYEGKRGIGALEYIPDTSLDSKEYKIDINELVKISNDVYENRESILTNEITKLFNVSTSAGGQRSKAIVQYNQKNNTFRSGQIDKAYENYDFYIVKFDDFKNEKYYTRIEYAYYLMAKDSGIDMMDSYLLNEDGKYHFLTKRFDRIKKEDIVDKLHCQTLMSLCGLDYDIPCQIGYEDVFDVFKKLNINNKNEQWFKRMVFNVITKNMDDHVKNTSFVMDKRGIWDLSSAYDITYAYNPNGKFTSSHQMSINGKYNNLLLDDLLKVAEYGHIKEQKAIEIIQNIEDKVQNFKYYAKKAQLPENIIKDIYNEFVFFSAKNN